MIKKIVILAILLIGFFAFNKYIYNEKQGEVTQTQTMQNEIKITPISHATMVLEWAGKVIYTDPVGGGKAFGSSTLPDIILITDIHGDHLDPETLLLVSKDTTVIVAPKEVVAKLPKGLIGKVVSLSNGEKTEQMGFSIEAVPMYNIPEKKDAFHTKGRGNGYLVVANGKRVYVSGDTSNIPEMKNLKNIDIAFLCMNLPYTMSIEEAVEATLSIKPKVVIPYHYRGPNGLSDTEKFKELVNSKDASISVNLVNFYP
ncbi:MAG: MBL fold metallo-hydrolase [Minisyncoccia bacterium]